MHQYALATINLRVENFCNNLQMHSYVHESLPPAMLSQMAAVYIECFTAAPRNEKWQKDDVIRLFEELMQQGAYCSVVVANGIEVAGLAVGLPAKKSKIFEELAMHAVDADDYYLDQLAIANRYQGCGLGRKLLREQLDYCAQSHNAMVTRCRRDVAPIQKLLQTEQFRRIASYNADTAGSGMASRLVLKKQLVAVN